MARTATARYAVHLLPKRSGEVEADRKGLRPEATLMKGLFRSYYRLAKSELDSLWKNGLIVPDANVLLNLYRYSRDTRSELIRLLKGVQPQLWLPHEVGVEFHQNRVVEILRQRGRYDSLLTSFNDIVKTLDSTRGHPFITRRLLLRLKSIHRQLERDLKHNAAELDELLSDDPILDELARLFQGRVGAPFSSQEMEDLRIDGESRYKQRTPPGFSDEKKPVDQRYGDLVIWKQILREAASRKEGVLFITDDSKEDWWLRISGKTMGPLPALREEFFASVGQPFHMYLCGPFMEHAAGYLKTDVQREAIKEVTDTQSAKVTAERIFEPIKTLDFSQLVAQWERDVAKIREQVASPDLTRAREQLAGLDLAKIREQVGALDAARVQEQLAGVDLAKIREQMGTLDSVRREQLAGLDLAKIREQVGALDAARVQEQLAGIDLAKIREQVGALDLARVREQLAGLDFAKIREQVGALDLARVREQLGGLDFAKIREQAGALDLARVREQMRPADIDRLQQPPRPGAVPAARESAEHSEEDSTPRGSHPAEGGGPAQRSQDKPQGSG